MCRVKAWRCTGARDEDVSHESMLVYRWTRCLAEAHAPSKLRTEPSLVSSNMALHATQRLATIIINIKNDTHQGCRHSIRS